LRLACGQGLNEGVFIRGPSMPLFAIECGGRPKLEPKPGLVTVTRMDEGRVLDVWSDVV
jgi:hypothetical protein